MFPSTLISPTTFLPQPTTTHQTTSPQSITPLTRRPQPLDIHIIFPAIPYSVPSASARKKSRRFRYRVESVARDKALNIPLSIILPGLHSRSETRRLLATIIDQKAGFTTQHPLLRRTAWEDRMYGKPADTRAVVGLLPSRLQRISGCPVPQVVFPKLM